MPIEIDTIDDAGWLINSFCGARMTQMWRDLILWELVLNDMQGRHEAIIELGTAHGGFSLFLLAQSRARRLKFYTFDNVDPILDQDELFGFDDPLTGISNRGIGGVAELGTHFRKVDVLKNTRPVLDILARSVHPVVLFCDNGDKPAEVELYAHRTPPGSLVVVHDWNREIFDYDIPGYLVEVYGRECDRMGSWTRFFRHGAHASVSAAA